MNKKHGRHFRTYPEIYQWSIESIPDFWARLWEFADIKASRGYDQVVDDVRKMPGAKWFSGARLNFAENLLRYRDDRPAFIFRGETQKKAQMTYAELYATVARLAQSLRGLGLKPGDRVAGYMPNMMETAIAMLAATTVGAVWSSCATDIGSQAALDRLGQIEPKVLFTVNGYYYKGKPFSSLGNAAEIAKGIPSLKKVIVASYVDQPPDLTGIPNGVRWEDFLAKEKNPPLEFEQLPFDHPVYIMFSSGTTGKAQVHGPGGRRDPDQPSEGTTPAHRPQAGGPHSLHHHLQLDDVELADQLSGGRGDGRPCMTGIPAIPMTGRSGSCSRMKRSPSSGRAPAISITSRARGCIRGKYQPLRAAGDLPDRLSSLRGRI